MQDGVMTYELNKKKGAPEGRLLVLNFDAYALLREALMFPYNERTTSFSSIAFS